MNDEWQKFDYFLEDGQRLDHFLTSLLEGMSRSHIQVLIDKGYVLVNGVKARKAGQSLKQADLISVHIPPASPTRLEAEDIPLDILFENQDVLVINKAAGIVVHPSIGHYTGTLVNAVLAHAPDLMGIGGEIRPGIVHRLDKDTSGVLIIAKNEHAHRFIQEQFQQREVDKLYIALVDGAPPTKQGRIEASLGRDDMHRQKITVLAPEKGRAAVSIYKVLRFYAKHTFLEVQPLSGRTHQIRVHLAFIGCPVVGDRAYGYKHPSLPLDRHFLHAKQLTVLLPGEREKRVFTAQLPSTLTDVMIDLK